jgi:hypothetical protein
MSNRSHDHQRDRSQARHDAAVTQAEIRRLALALAPYRVLSRDALEDHAGVQRWREGSFEQAVRAAVKSGALEKLPGGFYREPQ